MTKQTSVPALPSAEDAAALVAARESELAAIRADTATAEAAMPALALDPDDSAFESASLEIERMRRGEMRAVARLESAQADLLEAKAREQQDRRQTLHEAGKAAAAEVERLAVEYGRRATAVAETLREIHKHAETIRIADDNRPTGAPWFDVYGLRIKESVVLPAATKDGDYVWCRGEPAPRPPKSPGYVTVDGIMVQFDASNSAHVAARAAEKPTPVRTHHQPVGPQVLGNGPRKFTMPACEWPPKATD